MGINKESIKELESSDPEELVMLFGLTSEQIIRAFPGHAYDYIRDNFTFEEGDEDAPFEELERLGDEGFQIYDEEGNAS